MRANGISLLELLAEPGLAGQDDSVQLQGRRKVRDDLGRIFFDADSLPCLAVDHLGDLELLQYAGEHGRVAVQPAVDTERCDVHYFAG